MSMLNQCYQEVLNDSPAATDLKQDAAFVAELIRISQRIQHADSTVPKGIVELEGRSALYYPIADIFLKMANESYKQFTELGPREKFVNTELVNQIQLLKLYPEPAMDEPNGVKVIFHRLTEVETEVSKAKIRDQLSALRAKIEGGGATTDQASVTVAVAVASMVAAVEAEKASEKAAARSKEADLASKKAVAAAAREDATAAEKAAAMAALTAVNIAVATSIAAKAAAVRAASVATKAGVMLMKSETLGQAVGSTGAALEVFAQGAKSAGMETFKAIAANPSLMGLALLIDIGIAINLKREEGQVELKVNELIKMRDSRFSTKTGLDANTLESRKLNAEIQSLEAKQTELKNSEGYLLTSMATGVATSVVSIALMFGTFGVAAPAAVTAIGATCSIGITLAEIKDQRAAAALEMLYMKKFHSTATWSEGMQLTFPQRPKGLTNEQFQKVVLANLIEQVTGSVQSGNDDDRNYDNEDGSRMNPEFLKRERDLDNIFEQVSEDFNKVDEALNTGLEQLEKASLEDSEEKADWVFEPFVEQSTFTSVFNLMIGNLLKGKDMSSAKVEDRVEVEGSTQLGRTP